MAYIMGRLFSFMILLISLLSVVSAWDINNDSHRKACQGQSKHPKDGCDQKKTIFVDQVSPDAQFKTVQSGENHFNHSFLSPKN